MADGKLRPLTGRVEAHMRNAVLVVTGVTLVVLLSSFTPIWTRAPAPEQTLSSVSPWELMGAAKNLPTADRHETH